MWIRLSNNKDVVSLGLNKDAMGSLVQNKNVDSLVLNKNAMGSLVQNKNAFAYWN
jgi:hypothetical protein